MAKCSEGGRCGTLAVCGIPATCAGKSPQQPLPGSPGTTLQPARPKVRLVHPRWTKARKRERREGKEFRARDLDAHCHWQLSTICAPTPGKPKAERPCCRLRSPPVPTASQCCRDSRKFCQRMLAGEDISVTVRWLYEDGRCEVAQRRKDRL